MSNKTSATKDPQLKVVAVQIHRSPPAAQAQTGVQAWLDLAVEVENLGHQPLHVWSSQRGYAYDAASGVLTVHLAEVPLTPPPGIKMISDHPRLPAQVEVAANTRVKLRVRFPAAIRRPAGDQGQSGWRDDPIGDIKRVDVDVQYATAPVEQVTAHETSADFRKRMLAHGHVVRATITPTSGDDAPHQKEN